jgi:CheY-like chemotaxis protein
MAAILLVDGDPLQALVHVSVLQRQFSDVWRVKNAEEALCLVEQPQFARNLKLVIAAHRMPGLGGPEFVAELRERLPRLWVLVLGDGSEAAPEYSADRVSFVPGPARSEEILRQAVHLMRHILRHSGTSGAKAQAD